jgi:DNA modification methylase
MEVHRGDILDELPKIDSSSIDLIFTSPPYWKGFAYESYFNSYSQYLEWTKKWTSAIYRVLKDDGWFVLNIANDSETTCKAFEVLALCMERWKLHDTIIWNVYNRQPANTDRQLTNQTEFLFVFRKHSANASYYKEGLAEAYPEVFGTKNVGNVWKIPFSRSSHSLKKVIGGRANWGHSGFPAVLCELVIKLLTKEGDTILDCFGGTGIVGKTASTLHRKSILIDRNPIPQEL